MMVMNRLCLSHIYILCHIYMFFYPHSYLAQHLCIWRMRLLNFKGVWVLSKVSRWSYAIFLGYIKRFVLGKDTILIAYNSIWLLESDIFLPATQTLHFCHFFTANFLFYFLEAFWKCSARHWPKMVLPNFPWVHKSMSEPPLHWLSSICARVADLKAAGYVLWQLCLPPVHRLPRAKHIKQYKAPWQRCPYPPTIQAPKTENPLCHRVISILGDLH